MNNIPDADRLTLGKLIGTAEMVRQMNNRQLASEGIVLQAAASSIMTKEGGKFFQNVIKGLMSNG
ncbi:hypothetical protein SOP91_00385 (plasmid) [Enterobacter hormaechei]|uniref:hypothetical protein n=1 Tax=Enterobacter hormaechei TaxID=158836 RepID=UPI002B4BEAA6|nr:hypothetical protein [Enterobacter hormaechei]WRM07089.1 hypothetical protein SOP91_00385 [Enterobacter hormaechei]